MQKPRRVRSNHLRGNFRDEMDRVERHGEHLIVLRYNTPVVVIVPAGWYENAVRVIGGAA